MFSVGYETSWNTEGMASKETRQIEQYAIAQMEQVKHLQPKSIHRVRIRKCLAVLIEISNWQCIRME